MKNVINRAHYVMTGEDGASNLEIIVWMSVVLVIAGFLFLFRNKVGEFLNSVSNKVGSMGKSMNNQFTTGDAAGVVTPNAGTI